MKSVPDHKPERAGQVTKQHDGDGAKSKEGRWFEHFKGVATIINAIANIVNLGLLFI